MTEIRTGITLVGWGLLAGLFMAAPANAQQSYTGNIPLSQDGVPVAIEVALPPFQNGQLLATDLVSIKNLPAGVVPDERGCFCFSVDDDRMAYVHSFVFAQEMLTSYNQLLQGLGLSTLSGVEIQLTKDSSAPSTGSESLHNGKPIITLSFNAPTYDPFLMAHEIGHLIDQTISPRRLQPPPRAATVDWRKDAERSGIEEGTANVLAALYLGRSSEGGFSQEFEDSPRINNLDVFIRFPAPFITRRQVMEKMLAAPRFIARYPVFAQILRDNLGNAALNEYLVQPDEYSSSAIINQPLWHGAVKTSFHDVTLFYLTTLSEWRPIEITYSTFAAELVRQAPESLRVLLKSEYSARGILSLQSSFE